MKGGMLALIQDLASSLMIKHFLYSLVGSYVLLLPPLPFPLQRISRKQLVKILRRYVTGGFRRSI